MTTTERLQIEGMGCGHCVAAVKAALENAGARVTDVVIGEAEIQYDEDSVDRSELTAAIESAGYKVVSHHPTT